jgi:phage-related minor tail protein
MEPRKMAKQMIDFYKATFDNSYSALLMLQDQMQRMTSMVIEQSAAMPEEGKKALNEWLKAYKKGCEEFKQGVDENFKRVEAFFGGAEKSEKPKTV